MRVCLCDVGSTHARALVRTGKTGGRPDLERATVHAKRLLARSKRRELNGAQVPPII